MKAIRDSGREVHVVLVAKHHDGFLPLAHRTDQLIA